MPFLTGYGVEIAILIDVLGAVGLPAMAQVDLGSRQNRHQPLWDLTRMSSAVLRALARRVPPWTMRCPRPGRPACGTCPDRSPRRPTCTRSPPGTGCASMSTLASCSSVPPMTQALPAREEIPAYQANM